MTGYSTICKKSSGSMKTLNTFFKCLIAQHSTRKKNTDSEIFIAVTSASSSEYIAVSSIFTYDIYQTYFNPRASGKMLINMAHSFVIIYAILLAAFSTGLYCWYP